MSEKRRYKRLPLTLTLEVSTLLSRMKNYRSVLPNSMYSTSPSPD